MGCIETENGGNNNHIRARLIETWDVLKLILDFKDTNACVRLIETWDVLKRRNISHYSVSRLRINRNMGCIETRIAVLEDSVRERLIETWDVLKLGIRYICAFPILD